LEVEEGVGAVAARIESTVRLLDVAGRVVRRGDVSRADGDRARCRVVVVSDGGSTTRPGLYFVLVRAGDDALSRRVVCCDGGR
jgi:hypothetical protein